MIIKLQQSQINADATVEITGSKSESNRLLILRALYPNLEVDNLSDADDTMVLESALNSGSNHIDIHHAGTSMRFLTAYLSAYSTKEVTLTGSTRMQQRPIKILVDALRQLDADIEYTNNEGFPPLQIKGKSLTKNKVTIDANISSQYISALILIGPKLEKGLEITLKGEVTSLPYINMTLSLLKQLGVPFQFSGKTISISAYNDVMTKRITVESDWSAASYYYSLIALSPIGTKISLSSFVKDSLQGDAKLAEIYSDLGVETTFIDNKIVLRKTTNEITFSSANLIETPDLAQTLVVTCLGLGRSCKLTGLHTLKIKETDRLVALKQELEKLGATVTISEDTLELNAVTNLKSDIYIDTYNDHRMAMAFAPLALKTALHVNEAEVVTKSYPKFWDDLQSVGIKIQRENN